MVSESLDIACVVTKAGVLLVHVMWMDVKQRSAGQFTKSVVGNRKSAGPKRRVVGQH